MSKPWRTTAVGLLAALALGGCSPDLLATPEQLAKQRGVHVLAQVVPGARVRIHSSPDGPVVGRARALTSFNTIQVFSVVERRGRWLGVTTPAMKNDQLGWIAYNPFALYIFYTRWSLHASLSRRQVDVFYGKRLIRTIPVTIGRAGSSTPTGTFSVTEALAGKGVGPYYGCCVLALSGHQPNLPPGWIGGDRIAIHGTPGPVGTIASAGCLRAGNRDMIYLFSKVPIGTPVTITN